MIRWSIALRVAESRRDYAVAGFDVKKNEKGNGQCEGGAEGSFRVFIGWWVALPVPGMHIDNLSCPIHGS
jgi:hypothetical protein